MMNLSEYLHRQGRSSDAAPHAERVLELAPKRLGEEHVLCIGARQILSEIRFAQRRFDEAADHLRRYIEALSLRTGATQPATYLSALSDGLPILDAAQDAQTGEAYARVLYDRFRGSGAHAEGSSPRYGLHLARFLSQLGRHEEAMAIFQPALAAEADLPAEIRWRLDLCYGGHCAATGQYKEAERRLLAAELQLSKEGFWGVVARQELARLYESLGNVEESTRWATLANTPLEQALVDPD
jgi:tetratricopeptide (TPR) repeat protein